MRRRTQVRGVLLGLLSHWVALLVLAYVGAKITQWISVANHTVNPLKVGPFLPLSWGWAVSQPLIFTVGVFAGFVAAHWAPAKTWRAPVILALTYLVLESLKLPESGNVAVVALWLLLTPVGILLGAKLYMRKVECAVKPDPSIERAGPS